MASGSSLVAAVAVLSGAAEPQAARWLSNCVCACTSAAASSGARVLACCCSRAIVARQTEDEEVGVQDAVARTVGATTLLRFGVEPARRRPKASMRRCTSVMPTVSTTTSSPGAMPAQSWPPSSSWPLRMR